MATVQSTNSFDDPVEIEYLGTKGTSTYIGDSTFRRYSFGFDNRTGLIERADLEGFLNKSLRGTSIFRVVPEPVKVERVVTEEKDVKVQEPVVEEVQATKVAEVEEITEDEPTTSSKKKSSRKKKSEE